MKGNEVLAKNEFFYQNQAGNFRILLISALAVVIGLLAGLTAYALYALIGLMSNLVFFQRFSLTLPNLQNHSLGGWVVVVPAVGGLIVGLLAKYGSPKIRGHGIPEAMEAVLVNRSRIEPRVAALKPISAAIAIGTGGPFGAEGPIIQTGGALGSLVGQLIHVTAAERKVLLACGAAAGMAATFSTPIAAIILAIELLLFEFKTRSFIPLVIASTIADAIHIRLLGPGPMFVVGAMSFGFPSGLVFYALLGLICGFAAVGFSRAFYWVEDQFEHLSIDPMWWPVIGGLGLGIIGFFFPRVLGVGYDTITDILNNRLPLTMLLIVMVFKSLALIISLGSGTSGGLLAPMFMAGAALGGAYAILINQMVPTAHLSPGAFALIGMAAVFAAASRATFALIIFAFEITRDYNAILPLMLGCVIADAVAYYLMKHSIMTEKLARRGLLIHQDYEVDVFRQVTVGEVMDPNPVTVLGSMPISELANKIAMGDPSYARYQAFSVVDDKAQLIGIITRGDILKTMGENPTLKNNVEEVMKSSLVVAYPDELVHDAITKMLQYDIGRLPVVSRQNPKQLVGYLGRSGVLAARLRRIQEEQVLEPGWLRRTLNP